MRFVARYAWLVVVAMLGSLALATSASAGGTNTKNAFGSGQTSQFTCQAGGFPGTITAPAEISFGASKSRGTINPESGFGIEGEFVQKEGFFNGGTINNNSYTLTGGLFNANCDGTQETISNATVTLSGQCGNGVVIHYRDSLGEVGDFVGNVECITGAPGGP